MNSAIGTSQDAEHPGNHAAEREADHDLREVAEAIGEFAFRQVLACQNPAHQEQTDERGTQRMILWTKERLCETQNPHIAGLLIMVLATLSEGDGYGSLDMTIRDIPAFRNALS